MRCTLARTRATKPADEMLDHVHDGAHLVLVLAGRYVTDASHLEPARPVRLVYNPPGVTHTDRFRESGGIFFSLSIDDRCFERAGGRFETRAFESLRELAELDERVVVNCTGYGARALLAAAVIALFFFAAAAWREFKLHKEGRGKFAAWIAAVGFLAAAAIITYGVFA